MKFVHRRHKPPTVLQRPRELIVALPPMRSNVNLSRIVRAAGCFGIERLVACGNVRVDAKIARDGADNLRIDSPRTLAPALSKLRQDGYCLVGLEQADGSVSLPAYAFARRTALVVGHERDGLADDVLGMLDDVVEIPVYGLPHSHNAATAAVIAMYEYCRQYPQG